VIASRAWDPIGPPLTPTGCDGRGAAKDPCRGKIELDHLLPSLRRCIRPLRCWQAKADEQTWQSVQESGLGAAGLIQRDWQSPFAFGAAIAVLLECGVLRNQDL
jgi:hypothetical protein